MTDDVHSGSHPNVIPLRVENGGNVRVNLTPEKLLRIKMRMAEMKMDQSDLSAAAGLSNSAISQIFSGKIRATRHFPVIARALKVNMAWLLGETDQRVNLGDWKGETISEKDLPKLLGLEEFTSASVETIGTCDINAAELDRRGHSVPVPEIDLTQASRELSNGIPILHQNYMMGRVLLEMHTRADPAHVMVAQGLGDAMAPVLTDTDLVLIDTSRRTVDVADVIWLLRFAGMLTIRRVRATPQGFRLMAANPALPDEVVDAGQVEFLGKVVGLVRKM